jgi:hypothetical protein
MSPLGIVITILILVLFFMLLRHFFLDANTLQNIQDGTIASTITAKSLATNGANVPSSNFAYSVWFYVNDWNVRYGEKKVIFGRGKINTNSGHFNTNCPKVALDAVENNVIVTIDCFSGTSSNSISSANSYSVTNVPIQKWVNLVVSVFGTTMDLYLDGKLVRTCLLPGVVNIDNDADIHVTPAGGFAGWTSKLQYYPNSLNPQEAWNIYTQGYSNWSSMFSAYQIQMSVLENGSATSSVTI